MCSCDGCSELPLLLALCGRSRLLPLILCMSPLPVRMEPQLHSPELARDVLRLYTHALGEQNQYTELGFSVQPPLC